MIVIIIYYCMQMLWDLGHSAPLGCFRLLVQLYCVGWLERSAPEGPDGLVLRWGEPLTPIFRLRTHVKQSYLMLIVICNA